MAYRRGVNSRKTKATPHQRAEAELTRFGLSLPETAAGMGWQNSRSLKVRGKLFFVFGAPQEMPGGKRGDRLASGLTMVMKLPISAEMVQELYFVLEAKGWYKQHNWVIAHFDAEDDILAEMETLKAWLVQSYCAMAPKKLAKLVRGDLA
jgi:hypothetical protein